MINSIAIKKLIRGPTLDYEEMYIMFEMIESGCFNK